MTKATRPRGGYIFGHDEKGEAFTVNAKERQAHMHVIGSSGYGKSKFLERLIRQDLANRKVGACVIDPHGKLVDDVMDYVSHRAPHLAKRIVLFEPASQTEQITGFNPIPRQFESISTTVNSIVGSILFSMGQGNEPYPRVRSWLYNVIYLVVANKLTLVEALPVINVHSKDARQELYKGVNSASVLKDWEDFETLQTREKIGLLEGMQNRLRILLTNEFMRRVLSQQQNALDLGKIMADKKILLVSLRGYDRIERDDLRMLGIMLLKEIYRVGMQRQERSKPPAFHVYIDEFGRFVTPVVADALDEIRKKNVFFTLAHQHLAQLENDEMGKQILSSVVNNCRLKVAFGGLAPYDADQMSKLILTGKYSLEQIKHEQEGIRVTTRETTRQVITESETDTEGTSHTEGQSESRQRSQSHAQSKGQTQTHSEGGGDSTSLTDTKGDSSAENFNEGQSKSHTDGGSLSKSSSRALGTNASNSKTTGKSKTTGEADTDSSSLSNSAGHSDNIGRSNSESQYSLGDGFTAATSNNSGSSDTYSNSETAGQSKTRSNSVSEQESETEGTGKSQTDTKGLTHGTNFSDTEGTNSSRGGSKGTNASQSQGQTKSTSYSDSRAQSQSETHTESESEGESRSVSDGISKSKSRGRSRSHVPYDEKIEVPEVKSVVFWTPQEIQLKQQGKLMNLPTGIALMKNGIGDPAYVKVPYVKPVNTTERISKSRLAKAEAKILAANAEYYATPEVIKLEADERQKPIFGEPLQLDELSLDDSPLIEHPQPGDDRFNT